MKVVKRDGREVEFDKQKIVDAILKSFDALGEKDTQYAINKAKEIANYIEGFIEGCDRECLGVETIQDLVEEKLMKSNRKDVAKHYILYRDQRTRERERKSQLIQDIGEKITASNVQNQNANVDEHSFGGRMGEANSVVMKKYALDYCMSDMARNNHLNNEIYEHDLDHFVVGDHNCFQRNTAFVTHNGIKQFADFQDGDETFVLAKDGEWRKATVKCYGRKPMVQVTFKRLGLNRYKTVNCTSDHRWILENGEVTTQIAVGDRLFPLYTSIDYSIEGQRDAEMFAFGFILADGCDHYCHDNLNIQVRLCGDKNIYNSVFEKANYRKQTIKDSSDVVYIKRACIGKQKFLDEKMWLVLSPRDKQSLFNGFISADGSKTTNTKFIWTSDERVLNMIKDISVISGYHIYSIKEKHNDTNYKEDRTLYEITFTTQYQKNTTWEVISIEKQPNADYEAWCVEEPVTHSFVLEDGMVTGNCLTVPFDKLLATGFNTRQTDVRPAQSVNTAFQLVAVIFQLQSLQQFGGVSASHIDWTMVPYVRKSFYKHYTDGAMFIENKDGRWLQEYIYDYINDPECFVDEQSIESKHWKSEPKIYEYAIEMTKKETYQAVEGMYHNLNTLQSRSGNQLPFTSINYGTCTLPEGRMVTKAILDVSIEGIGALHKTSIFPCGIFQYMKGVNDKPGTPNYDLKKLAIKSTAKRLYPNYVNVDWSVNKGYDRNDPTTYVSTMGCRTYNGFDINGLGQKKDGRGNICPVTIIMPTLAMEAKEQAEKMNMESGDYYDNNLVINRFFEILDTKIHEAKDMLIERFNWICSQSPDSAKFMYENGLMEGYVPEEGIRSALKHGTIVIGQLGLAETLQILIGCDHTTEKGMELAKKIEQLFKDRCAEFKQEYKLNFGVYYTPAENLCFTAMKKFKDKYGVIPNVSDKKFFTNSIHVPVWKKMNPFEKIDIESQLTGYSNAGCITYVELESSVKNNLDAVEAIIDYAMEKDVPYFAINVPNDLCLDCGYTDDIDKECPQCGGNHIQRLRRVTGLSD